jgi:flagellar hook-basal body complex protein FliE
MITPFAAAKAYASTQGAGGLDMGGSAAKVGGVGGGFADLLKNAITDAAHASKAAETQMANQVQGKAELVDVVTAISSAQSSMETVMAVRDQVISAYQEIMRMPI